MQNISSMIGVRGWGQAKYQQPNWGGGSGTCNISAAWLVLVAGYRRDICSLFRVRGWVQARYLQSDWGEGLGTGEISAA